MTPGALLEPHGRLLELVDEVWTATATENPPSSIKKTQVGFGWVVSVQNNRVSINRVALETQRTNLKHPKQRLGRCFAISKQNTHATRATTGNVCVSCCETNSEHAHGHALFRETKHERKCRCFETNETNRAKCASKHPPQRTLVKYG